MTPAVVTISSDSRPLRLPGRILVITVAALALAVGLSSGYGFLAAAPYAFVGAFLAIRRSQSSIGLLLLALAWAFVLAFANVSATGPQLLAGTAPQPEMALAILQGWGGGALLTLLLVITIVFPSGRLPTGRWRTPARLVLALAVLLATLSVFAPTISVTPLGAESGIDVPNPLAVLPGLPLWAILSAGIPILFALVVAGVVSMLVRLHRVRGVERAQLRWLVWSLAFILVGFVIGLVGDQASPTGFGGLVWVPAEIAFPLPPLAIGVAVLRYRLYEIDRLVSRTIGWAVVTVIVSGLFVGLILALQAILAPLTSSNELAVAGSTLLVFALFAPLRRRVQRLVDHRFNRARYDAEQTVANFAARLANEVDLERLRDEITATVAAAVEPSSLSLWLRT
jgi:hypothetical protein